jgi:signal transduction histidine kinase
MINNDKNLTSGKTVESTLEEYIKEDNWAIKTIFDEISIGIIILNYRERTVLFANKYFHSIVKNKEKIILNNIYNYISTNINMQKKLDVSQDIEIDGAGGQILLTFTTYPISEAIIVVFLSEMSSRLIYFLTKQENLYYNKLSELTAEIAHEIGNPLSGINTSLQVMLHNISTWSMEKVKDYIERTINEINRLSDFLKRMREVSNEDKLELKPTNLKGLIDRILLQNEDILKQKEITFKNMVDKNIEISIDEGAFFQIILNLLNNSMQILLPNQEIKIYVEEVDEFFIKLVYRNNGKPIPEELMEKIFSPLYTTKGRGEGIGLPISLKLMTRMGGSMKAVPPEDGIGAKFILYIPNYSIK